MGKCIKCGKETKNEYTFYSADVHSSFISSRTESRTFVSTYAVSYHNPQKHCEYMCAKCMTAKKRRISAILMIIGAIFGCMGLSVAIVSLVRNLGANMIQCAIFIMAGVAAAIFYIVARRPAAKDERLKDGDLLICDVLPKIMKTKSGRRFISPNNYESLCRRNACTPVKNENPVKLKIK